MATKRSKGKDNIAPFPAPPPQDANQREWSALSPKALAEELPSWATDPLKAYVQIETPRRTWEAWCADYEPLVKPGTINPSPGVRLHHVLENTSYLAKGAEEQEITVYRRTYWPQIDLIGATLAFYPMVVELSATANPSGEGAPNDDAKPSTD